MWVWDDALVAPPVYDDVQLLGEVYHQTVSHRYHKHYQELYGLGQHLHTEGVHHVAKYGGLVLCGPVEAVPQDKAVRN